MARGPTRRLGRSRPSVGGLYGRTQPHLIFAERPRPQPWATPPFSPPRPVQGGPSFTACRPGGSVQPPHLNSVHLVAGEPVRDDDQHIVAGDLARRAEGGEGLGQRLLWVVVEGDRIGKIGRAHV